MKKRIISLLLVGMMMASLATACGKGNEPEQEKPNSSNET